MTAALLSACMPAVQTPIVPSGNGPAVQTPPAASAPVTGSDPAPAPAAPRPVTVALVFPPGTLTLLQSGLRTQADVREQDLSPADLARLVVTIDGKPIPASALTVTSLQWDSAGGIRATVRIEGQTLPPGARLTVALPSGRLVLVTVVTDGATVVDVSLASTARTLLQDALATLGKPAVAIPDEAVALVAARLGNVITSTAATDPLLAPTVTTALAALADAIIRGVPPSQFANQPNLNPVATGGGGGGGGTLRANVGLTVTPQNGNPYAGTPQGGNGH
jgi:hypothetical protein